MCLNTSTKQRKQTLYKITFNEDLFLNLALTKLKLLYLRNYSSYLARSANLPEELYILLALISLFFNLFFNDRSENNYFGIRWTDFCNLFIERKFFWVQMIDLHLFFRYLNGRCHDNQFCEKMANSPHSSLLYSKTEWDIATSLCPLTA